jgi:hypothetical protein
MNAPEWQAEITITRHLTPEASSAARNVRPSRGESG